MRTYLNCKNFKAGNIICEMCIINKKYVDLQNSKCISCLEPDNNIKL